MASKPPFKVTAATLDVLEVLLTGGDELYGLKIAKMIQRPSGSVVPILMRLEAAGWVTSQWEPEPAESRGPRRRFYQIDPNHAAGARALILSRRPGKGVKNTVLRPGYQGT